MVIVCFRFYWEVGFLDRGEVDYLENSVVGGVIIYEGIKVMWFLVIFS